MSLTDSSGVSSGYARHPKDTQTLLANSGAERILSDLSLRFTNLASVRRALLVGQRARGEHDDRSDVSVALSMPDTTDSDWSRIQSMVSESPTLLRINLIHLESCTMEQRLQAKFWVERAYDEARIAPLVEKIPRHYALLRGAAGMLRDLFGLD